MVLAYNKCELHNYRSVGNWQNKGSTSSAVLSRIFCWLHHNNNVTLAQTSCTHKGKLIGGNP